MSLDETITRLLRSRSDAIDRNIQSLLRGNRVVIYIYKIKKDDGDITAAYVNESLKRGMESECSSDNITISLRREFRRTREERRGRIVERITTGRCNPLTRDFTRRLGERNN